MLKEKNQEFKEYYLVKNMKTHNQLA